MKGPIYHAIMELDEDKVLQLVKKKIEENCPSLIIIEEVREGVEEVGTLYEQGEFYIADLIMVGIIFENTVKLLNFPKIENILFNNINVVFATVEKDIHDVGKNISIELYRSKGIKVIDLGVDVPAKKIVEEVEKIGAPILCLSGLINASYKSMKKTVNLLVKRHLRNKVKVIIGGNVDEEVRVFTGADYWTKNCSLGLQICERIAQEYTTALADSK